MENNNTLAVRDECTLKKFLEAKGEMAIIVSPDEYKVHEKEIERRANDEIISYTLRTPSGGEMLDEDTYKDLLRICQLADRVHNKLVVINETSLAKDDLLRKLAFPEMLITLLEKYRKEKVMLTPQEQLQTEQFPIAARNNCL